MIDNENKQIKVMDLENNLNEYENNLKERDQIHLDNIKYVSELQNEIKLKTSKINELLNSIETKNCQIEDLKNQNLQENNSTIEEKEIQFVERLREKENNHNSEIQKLKDEIQKLKSNHTNSNLNQNLSNDHNDNSDLKSNRNIKNNHN